VPDATFEVLDGMARRRAVGPDIRRIAEKVLADTRARSAAAVAASWTLETGPGDPATWWIANPLRLARYIEYGTRRSRPRPALGPAMAASGYPRWPRTRRRG